MSCYCVYHNKTFFKKRMKLTNDQKHRRKTSMAFHRLVFEEMRDMEMQRAMALVTLWFPRKVWGVEHPDSSLVSKMGITPGLDRVSLHTMTLERNFKLLWWLIDWIHILTKASCLPLQSHLLSQSVFSRLQPFWAFFFFFSISCPFHYSTWFSVSI